MNCTVPHGLMVLAIATAMASCSRGSDVTAQFATALASAALAEELEAETSGNLVMVAGTPFRVVARTESVEGSGPAWIVGIEVTATIDGGPSFGAGSVGIGASRDEAVEAAANEWAQFTGLALLRGLVLKAQHVDRVVLNGIAVYRGTTGIRGPVQPTWSKGDAARLFELVLPSVPVDGQPHLLSVVLAVDATKEVDGECRVDGTISPAMLEAVKLFSWERLKTPYIFKQYYLASPAQ
jgi:hypothetical protein